MMAKNSEPPAPLDQRGVPLPPAAVDAVMRGLSRDPAARFPSCRDLALAFTDGGDAIDTQAIVVPNLPPLQQRGIRAAILAVLGLLAAMGLGFRLLRGGAPDHEGRIAAAAAPENQVGERPQAQTARAPKVAEPGMMAGTFQAGTTEEELADALRLCRGYASDCPASLYDDEELRVVAVGPFELDRTEVTNRDFAAFVAGTGYTTTAEERGTSRDGPFAERGLGWRRPAGPRSSHQDLPDHPVVHVSAPDAEAYCAYARGRLPTEDEWEFAARSEDRRLFPWGPQWDANAASWASSTTARARPVGTFPPGPFGHRDLAGNVWEWTATRQDSQRILKGGSWMEINPADLRSAARLLSDPTDRSSDIGFRCARDVTR
jgi:formylglycine-generating enzyme required for sulfatase activity